MAGNRGKKTRTLDEVSENGGELNGAEKSIEKLQKQADNTAESETESEAKKQGTEPIKETRPRAERTQKPKSTLVNKEKRRLLKLFAGIDENKKDFVKEQINNLAWYTVSVKILQERIDETGTLIEYNNGGGQSGQKENPDVKTMLGYQKNINDITKQLTDLVPSKPKNSKFKNMMEAMGEL